MRTSINLATSPFANARSFLLAATLLSGVVLALGLVLLVVGVSTWGEKTSMQARMRALESQRAGLAAEQVQLESELRRSVTQQLFERTRFLNQLLQRKGLSWTELFFDLQARLPARARILRLAPTLREDGHLLVELRVGGASPAVVIEFLQALEESEKFHDLVLESQRRAPRTSRDAMVAQVSAVYVQE